MGQIVRLNESFSGTGLQKLVSYDTSKIRDELLKVTTLRGFYDFTDTSSMTMSGTSISQINDLSGNNLHFKQVAAANNPTYAPSAFNGVGGVSFSGNKYLLADSLFSASKVRTVIVFVRARGAGNRIIIGKPSSATENLYVANGSVKIISGDVTIVTDVHEYSDVHIIGAYDGVNGDGYLSVNQLSQTVTGTLNKAAVSADSVYVGRWSDSKSDSFYVGDIGHVMVFDEDISKNIALLNLIKEYAFRKYHK